MDATKTGPALAGEVLEVQGAMPNDAALQDALGRLTLAGFDRADLSLPDERAQAGGGLPTENAENPVDATDKAQVRTMGASMAGYAGAAVAAGATIATGGAAGLAIGLAAAAGAGSALAANAAGQAADAAQTTERDRKGAAGTLILAVRTPTGADVDRATQALRQAGATAVTPVSRQDSMLTAGISSASWTGA